VLVDLSRALEVRDDVRGHGARVGALAEAVARGLRWDEERIAVLRLGSLVHDVGKVAVDAAILRKPGPLTESERARVREHPRVGAALVGPSAVLPCVLYHHERWDGAGYPIGLGGDEIPVEARLLALADAYDAMTSARPYRAALPRALALAELDRCAGTQFDPELAACCCDVWVRATTRPRASAACAGSPRP
jgi:HD-GYP domain-containing protein (c-di-GMP phosphodiesterase class II)